MSLWNNVSGTGLNFAKTPAERRGILLSNQISSILIGLQVLLFLVYAYWYGWNFITAVMPFFILLFFLTIFLNSKGFVTASRIWLCVVIPVLVTAVSIYAKILYYANQEELDYFTFRFVILASCIFPPILFSIRETGLLHTFLLFDLLVLMAFDPLHHLFGVPYNKETMSLYYYYFTNVVILMAFGLISGAVWFLKWTSEKFEEKNDQLIEELNQINGQLMEKNSEIEAQNQEITAQSETLNINQQKLTDAYFLIEEQRNLLFHQNKDLSSELVQKNQDLTATNAELIKYNGELRQFSYTVSHNLRGPVASLLGLINLVDYENLPPGNAELISHIKTSAKRLDTIITELSQIIDIRQDIFQIRQKVNFEHEIRDILQGLQKDIEQHGVVIETDFRDIPALYSIQPMVHSILYNLISNAIKYRSPERQPVIKLNFREDPYYVVFEIIDNGLGIDLNRYKDNLFKLYKRFHHHTEGKGLGLYLVKLQAEALGGYIHAESEMNRYTRFTVYFRKPDNVTRQTLYKQPHAEIFFDAHINSTGVIWNGPVTSEQYREVFQKCLDFVKEYNTPNYIADLSRQGHIEQEDQHWMFSHIMPEAVRNGLTRIAAIRPDVADEHVQGYLNRINETLMKIGVLQKFFLSMEEATAWIADQNEKIAKRA
jgi:signal transduction histidine kinase